ncbi:MAG: GAF domain-containing protein [Deltaproteobacteria bacterium]|nr:GAF domain-containing protein [Deltaproteobacteria bacterium]
MVQPVVTQEGASSPVLVRTLDDLVTILGSDPRFDQYPIRARGDGFVEVALPDGCLVMAWPDLWRDRSRLNPHLTRARAGYLPLVLLGTDAEFAALFADELRNEGEMSAQALPMGRERLAILLRNYREICRMRRESAEGELLADRYRYELDEFNAIGRALSSERNLDKLLALILEKTRYVTGADAGSVYVVEGEHEEIADRTLHFKVSQNDSLRLDFTEFTLPVSADSIVGRCVMSGEVINIPDLYRLDNPGTGNNPWGFQHNRAFDAKTHYQTRSMLTVPMIDAADQVIGVIQLINKKRRPEARLQKPADFDQWVVPFDTRSQELAKTLASQAGISLENALLYEDIRQLFDGFVRASVTAIESRDPTTSGHSQRVADLTVGLAMATEKEGKGEYEALALTPELVKKIEYAALLHDFGKVGVRENVLVKAKKLLDHEKELILARFGYIRKSMEADCSRRKAKYFLECSREEGLRLAGALDADHAAKLRELDEFVDFILRANEPTVLDQGGFERIEEIARHTFVDEQGNAQRYLSASEVHALEVPRGSLTDTERRQIESHVVHTFNFLRQIPWGRSLRDIPEIAGAHHEKMDGSGYPRGIKGDKIPIPSRMMTIADIFDALTAFDRPYKKAVPVERALDIIALDVKQGKCDPELFRIFVEAKIYEIVIR